MALGLADLLERGRHEVELYSPTSCRPRLHSGWDHRVRSQADESLPRWARRQDHVIWTMPPAPEVLRHMPGATGLVLAWVDPAQLEPAYQEATHLVVPCESLADRLSAAGLARVSYLPWSWGRPLSRQRAPIAEPKFYLPPLEQRGPFVDSFLNCLVQVCLDQPQIHLTVNLEGWPRRLVRPLKALARSSQRLALGRSLSYPARVLTYGQYDLTILPGVDSPLALQALWSLSCGTPIYGVNLPPLCELVAQEGAGRLASAQGLTRPEFEDQFLAGFRDPELISRLETWRSGCVVGLGKKQEQFQEFWMSRIFPVDG